MDMFDHDVIKRFLQWLDCSARDDEREIRSLKNLIRCRCASDIDKSDLDFLEAYQSLVARVRLFVRSFDKGEAE